MNRMNTLNQKVSMAEKLGYSLGDCSANFVFQMMMIYQTKFYTDVFGLEGAIAGSVMLLARIVDAFVDPTVGILSDRTKSKWGKYRPWVLWTALPFMVFYILAFYNPGIEDKGLVAVYATISYTLLMTLYSFNNTPYASLGGVMTSDIKERNSITSIRFVAATIAQFIVQGLTLRWSASLPASRATKDTGGSARFRCLPLSAWYSYSSPSSPPASASHRRPAKRPIPSKTSKTFSRTYPGVPCSS